MIADITAPAMPEAITLTPVYGIGATIVTAHAQRAATVVNVLRNGKTVWVQRDSSERIDGNGISQDQQYVFSRNTDSRVEVFTLRKDGSYVSRGDDIRHGARLTLGIRREYQDYSI